MRCQRVAVRPISNLLAVPAAITAPQLNQRLERLPRGIPFTVRRYLNGSAAAAPGWGAGTKILQTVDCHAEGEPARVVVGGVPAIPGETMYEKRAYFMDNLDGMRKLLLTEPRGYPCQNADVIVEPTLSDAAYGVLILEQGKIYPAMSGHNIICVATALLETGMVPMVEPTTEFNLETPAGLIEISAACGAGRATAITLKNQPAFVAKLGAKVDVPCGVGKVSVDIAYGGMWYAVVDASSVGLELVTSAGKEICRLGEMIKVATREQYPVNHPEFEYPGVDNMVFRGPASSGSGATSRNAVVMTNGVLDWDKPETHTGMIDRSPCGTGTCAVMATLHARGELQLNEPFIHESIVGTTFTGTLTEATSIGGIDAVVPTISGSAWITQHCQVVCHPTDPFPEGYTVGDIWAE